MCAQLVKQLYQKKKLKEWITTSFYVLHVKKINFTSNLRKNPPNKNVFSYYKQYRNNFKSIVRLAKNISKVRYLGLIFD